MKINNITTDSSDFLQILGGIAKSPKSLYFLGNIPEQRRPTVAIVGSRKPTPYGQEVGYQLAYDLAKQGVVIVSGLALGMDAIVHRAALDAGGTTIAVMPGGLSRIYPHSHRELAIRILTHGGALVSEYSADITPKRWTFVARSRIVTGISDGLLIVEATAKSGTIHTAGFALEQGRAVMAVPGNITSPLSEGCNNLLRTGARLVAHADDILQEIGYSKKGTQTALPMATNAEEYIILQLLARGIRDGDTLQAQSELHPTTFSQTLTMLELNGKIKPLGANQWGLQYF